MPFLDQMIRILNDSPLSFKAAILVGIVFLIIAAVPAISVLIFKTQALILTRQQSIILGVIGFSIILGGITGLASLADNVPPIIYSIQMDPNVSATAFNSGTPVKIAVMAEDPDNNLMQKLFAKVIPLQYEFSYIHPETSNSVNHIEGPDMNNECTWMVTPSLKGQNVIIVNVFDRPPGDNDSKSAYFERSYRIELPNQPPEINEVFPNDKSSRPIDKRITIRAKASDPENDRIYYRFFRVSPPPAQHFSEILPCWNGQDNERYWVPNASDIGENMIIVSVCDGDKNGPFRDHENVTTDFPISVTG